MILDTGLPDYDLRAVSEFARQAERIGYGALWTSETQHDPFLPLGVGATCTSTLKLGTSIAVAFPRSPMTVAYTCWDLQRTSEGRFVLGLGSQVKAHNERRFSVKFESPGPKLREYILALRSIWECWQTGKPLAFKGEFYSFTLMTPAFNPGPVTHPKIPIFTAAVNQYMCRMAGEVCDGIHMHPFHTAKYAREFVHPNVEKGLRAAGRERNDFEYVTAVFAVVGDTESERAKHTEAVRQKISFYASTRTYEPVLAAHGWEGIIPELHRKSVDGDWKGMVRLITDEMLDAIAISGTYESIGAKLKQRYEGVADRVWLYQPYKTRIDQQRLKALTSQFKEQ